MDAQKKAARLKLLKEIGNRHQDQEGVLFDGLSTTKQDVREIVEDMDSFREERRQNRGEALTSDEA